MSSNQKQNYRMEINNKEEGLLAIGTTLANGKYRIEKYLSSGGFGKTYLATDTAFDEWVAIKELYIKGVCGRNEDSNEVSVTLTENQRAFSAQQEKFRKEARRLRKLSSNHIVRVHDLFDDNNTSYYVMDYVEGESLSQRLKRTGKPLNEAEVYKLLPQILDALATVHREHIWHLDLKPANIMLDKMGCVKLIDFGASKQLKNSNGDSLSTSSALAYTQGYAPAEQTSQEIEKFGPWTDIYALGATLFNLLTCSQPPSQSDIEEDVDEAFPLPPSVSQKTKELIVWMMKPNRKMRPQSVDDIRQYLDETPQKPSRKPVVAPSPKTTLKSDDTIIKNPKSQPAPEPTPEPEEENTSNKKKKWIVVGVIAVVLGGGLLFTPRSGGLARDNNSDIISKTDSDTVEVYVDLVAKGVLSKNNEVSQYSYTGMLDPDGLPIGKGKAVFSDNRVYEGNFDKGQLTGDTCKFTFPEGDVFEGTMKNGQFVVGKYTFSDGSYFVGVFKNGECGNGTFYDKNGNITEEQ